MFRLIYIGIAVWFAFNDYHLLAAVMAGIWTGILLTLQIAYAKVRGEQPQDFDAILKLYEQVFPRWMH